MARLSAFISCLMISMLALADGFPKSQPERGCFLRPRADERLDITPPGFCWWRAGEPGNVRYRLKVADISAATVCESPVLDDPAFVPGKTFPPGEYYWSVDALDSAGQRLDTLNGGKFIIAEDAVEQPWIPAETLLARVPKEDDGGSAVVKLNMKQGAPLMQAKYAAKSGEVEEVWCR